MAKWIVQSKFFFATGLLGALIFSAGLAVAAGQTYSGTARFENGRAEIYVQALERSYRLTLNNGALDTCHAVQATGARLLPLAARAPKSARNLSCKCGHECWEDNEVQQSICVCRSCPSGGAFGDASLDFVVDAAD